MRSVHQSFALRAAVIALMAGGCGAEHDTSETHSTMGGETASTMSHTMPMESSPAAATAPYDLQFLDTMSKHHQGAVEMAAMARGKIEHPGLQKLVERIPGDQQKESDQMKAWRDQWYPGAALAENMEMPGMAASMNMDMGMMKTMGAGHDYDVMFIDMMVPHHEGALVMSREALTRAEHPEVKTLAQQIIDAQTREIEQMKKWKASGSKAPSAQ